MSTCKRHWQRLQSCCGRVFASKYKVVQLSGVASHLIQELKAGIGLFVEKRGGLGLGIRKSDIWSIVRPPMGSETT